MTGAAAQTTRWPEPETLEAGDIDRLFVELRARREELMRELRGLKSCADASSTPATALDLVEARLNLNAVLCYWRQLLARLLSLQDWPALGSEPPCFADLRGDGFHRVARALVPLTPDSMLFVHGPVTLWHAAALAETLLEAGDRLTYVLRGGFHRELVFEPDILVWDKALGAAPVDFDADAVAVSGAFATEAGRELAFVALPSPSRVPTRRAGWHPVTASIIAAAPAKCEQPAAFSHRLTPDCFPGAGAVSRGSAALLAKAEALIAAFTQHILVGERVLLLSRALTLAVEADFGAWLAGSPEIRFELDWTRQKPIPGRGAFVPFRYRIVPDDAQWQRSMFICLDSHLDFLDTIGR